MTHKNTLPAVTPHTFLRAAFKLSAATLVALSLAGCKHDEAGTQVAGWTLVDPAAKHPIIVSQQPQTLPIIVARGSQGLTPQQRAALLAFADKSRVSDAGNSRLVISAPSGSRNEVASMHAVGEIRHLLSDRGFAEDVIQVDAYSGEGAEDPPIKVSYMRFVADGPECGTWPTNLAHESSNLPSANIGCANQRNLAAMVANPADLLGPRTESARSSERRDAVWDKYIRGESSATQKVEDEKVNTRSSGSN